MKIQIWLWGHLTQYVPDNNTSKYRVLEASQGTSIRKVLEHLEIPEWAVNLIFLNGIQTQDKEILKDGDRLTVFPRILVGG